ncbi:MAG: 16S rRNA (guanine(527)-N(7))-methyltransferase RsmG [Phycisphaeraceae bacterium]|nr:16S rRNA (guanine(527)-N(7))-methyltransferase RsmG [Phycisphaeraceae bacterium]
MPETQTPPLEPLAPTPEFLAMAAELGIEFEPGDLERLGLFLALLLRANELTNLTAITDPAQAWVKHIFDALTLVPVLASIEPAEGRGGATHLRIIDVGSGGGVPALPLAIVMPEAKFTLLEATGKKCEFLRSAAAALSLKNVEVIQGRAETVAHHRGSKNDGRINSRREVYDAAIARALGHLAVLVELLGAFARPGGFVLAVKGAKAEQELTESAKAMGVMGLRHAETVQTPTGRIVVLEKASRTPRDYPRKDGEPSRKPIGIG